MAERFRKRAVVQVKEKDALILEHVENGSTLLELMKTKDRSYLNKT